MPKKDHKIFCNVIIFLLNRHIQIAIVKCAIKYNAYETISHIYSHIHKRTAHSMWHRGLAMYAEPSVNVNVYRTYRWWCGCLRLGLGLGLGSHIEFMLRRPWNNIDDIHSLHIHIIQATTYHIDFILCMYLWLHAVRSAGFVRFSICHLLLGNKHMLLGHLLSLFLRFNEFHYRTILLHDNFFCYYSCIWSFAR